MSLEAIVHAERGVGNNAGGLPLTLQLPNAEVFRVVNVGIGGLPGASESGNYVYGFAVFANTLAGGVVVAQKILLEEPLSKFGGVSEYIGTGMTPTEGVWNGAGYVDIVVHTSVIGGSSFTSLRQVTYDVPTDCIHFLPPHIPSMPTFGDVPSGLFATWIKNWKDAYRIGVSRRKAWIKQSSDKALQSLRNGVLPSGWSSHFSIGIEGKVRITLLGDIENGQDRGVFSNELRLYESAPQDFLPENAGGTKQTVIYGTLTVKLTSSGNVEFVKWDETSARVEPDFLGNSVSNAILNFP